MLPDSYICFWYNDASQWFPLAQTELTLIECALRHSCLHIACTGDTVLQAKALLNPIQRGGGEGGMVPHSKNVFDHCAQTLRRRKLKLDDF